MKSMNNIIEDEILLSFPPFDIQTISKGEILNDEVFEYLTSIDNIFQRDILITKLEDKANDFKCLTAFQKKLNLYMRKTFNTGKLTHNEVADLLLKNNHIVTYENRLYIYKDGYYQSDKKKIEKKIIEIIPEAKINFMNEIYRNLELKTSDSVVKIDKESSIVNFKNGLYYIKENKLKPHSPDFFSLNQINTNYIEEAPKIQAVDDFLDKISSYNKKRKQAILEWIGYSCTTSIKLQKSCILYGETACNGKSTLCNVITSLIGKENISNISLKDMTNNTFSTFEMKDKLLNIGAEMNEDFLNDMSTFKMFSSGDDLSVEEKFKSKQSVSPYVKLIFIANELPSVADKTNGFYRRLEIIPLETSFTEEDSKNFHIEDLLTSNALEYLAKISLEAYANMDGYFSNKEESDKEVAKYKLKSNSLQVFICDKEFNPLFDYHIHLSQDIYDSYKDYCLANNFFRLGRNKFYEEIEKLKIVNIGSRNKQKTYQLIR